MNEAPPSRTIWWSTLTARLQGQYFVLNQWSLVFLGRLPKTLSFNSRLPRVDSL